MAEHTDENTENDQPTWFDRLQERIARLSDE